MQPTYDMSAVQGCNTPWSQLPGKPYTRGDDSLCPSGNCEDSPTDAKLLEWYNEYSAGRNGECEGFKLSKLIGEYVDATNVEVDIEERKTGTFCPDFDDYVVGGTCEYKDGVFTGTTYDKDAAVRAKENAKHGNRAGYNEYLCRLRDQKYDAEVDKKVREAAGIVQKANSQGLVEGRVPPPHFHGGRLTGDRLT